MVDLSALLADLAAEGDEVDGMVAGLPAAGWETPTPATGWTVRSQIAHLAWTDRALLLAATDEPAFAEAVRAAAQDPAGVVEGGVLEAAGQPPAELLAGWRDGRRRLVEVLAATPADRPIPWYGPPMRPAAQATGRLMETWAHGQDVADGLGVERQPTARLRHVAHLGVRTLGWSFLVHGEPVPEAAVRVELAGPDGATWTWGPADAADRVTGPALDFCLRVTQRRHRADLALAATGRIADRWLDLAQAFAGPPGRGREPAGGRR